MYKSLYEIKHVSLLGMMKALSESKRRIHNRMVSSWNTRLSAPEFDRFRLLQIEYASHVCFVTFQYGDTGKVPLVMCGTRLYRLLIFFTSIDFR